MGGTVLGALTAPQIVDATSLAVPFWSAGVVAVMAPVFWTWREDARATRAGVRVDAPRCAVFREPGSGAHGR